MHITYAYSILVCVIAKYYTKTKKEPLRNMTWRPTIEDRKLMEELRAKLGVSAEAELMRLGLRALAAKEGVAA